MDQWKGFAIAEQWKDPEIGSPDTYQRAEELLRDLVPGTFSAEDPAPQRNILFGIFIREITGRTAQSVT